MRTLFEDPSFDFVARTALGHAAMGNIDLGFAIQVLESIDDGDAASWLRCWSEAGERLEQRAAECRARGLPKSSGWFSLGASECFDTALAFIDGIDDPSILPAVFGKQTAAWDAFLDAAGETPVRFRVPAGSGPAMPAVLLRPDASGAARPTVIVVNGSDGSLTTLWAVIARGALERDWNVLLFDGPGQQSMLFEHDVPFRPDWEAVLPLVVDAAIARPDVDAARLTAFGISQGGYWLPRALAFEHRFAAAAVDGGVVDVGTAWRAELPAPALALLDAGERDRFNALLAGRGDARRAREFAFRARPYGAASPYDVFKAVEDYRLGDLAGRIETPMLVIEPEGERTWPGQSRDLFDRLRGDKELLQVGERDGGAGHCEPMARGLVEHRVLDFLESRLPA